MSDKSSKNRGWSYLFSEGNTFLNNDSSYEDTDGSRARFYSDGSGYYEGADGSKARFYSDGSSYYEGSDGSRGRKYSDGSGYYDGADGSKGRKYSDGSGYYDGANGSKGRIYYDGSGYYDGANANSYSSNEESSSFADLGGLLLGIGLVSLPGKKQKEDVDQYLLQQERDAQEKARREEQWAKKEARQKEQRQKRKAFCRKHRKGILVTILCAILAIVLTICIWQYRKMIPISYDSNSLLGMNYSQVKMLLNEAGFTNVMTECTRDLVYENIEKENQVYQVYVFGKNSFDATDKYPYDTKITVKYHGVKLISAPRPSKEMKGANYEDIVAEFESAGFANIQLVVKYDIITGWLTDVGEVESVTVNGEKRFTEKALFRPDAEIIITYHTLKKNKEAE